MGSHDLYGQVKLADVDGLVAQLAAKAALNHAHDAGDLTTGTIALARIPTAADGASSASAVPLANDSRLSNARTPVAHAASHAPGGSDDLSSNYLALAGAQTVAGTKTASGSWIFNAPPQVAQGTLLNHAARRDDPRFVPAGGASGQVLGKASATDHDLAWVTPATGGVPTTRQIAAGTGLTGGGDLSADRTLAVAYGTAAGTAAQGNDSRITGAVQTSDARVTADQAAGTASIRTLGTGAQQAAAGNHSHTPASIGAVPTARAVTAGTGLSGGGDLSADRALAVVYGAAAGTAVQGNDSRVTADQVAGTASIRTLGTGALQAAAGNHSHTPASIGAAAASHQHAASDVLVAARTVTYANLPSVAPLAGVALDVITSVLTGNPTITPGAGTDGQILRIRMTASGAQRTPAVGSTVRLGTGITDRSMAIPSGQVGVFGLEWVASLGTSGLWVLFSEYVISAS